jgi:hypothetical protein
MQPGGSAEPRYSAATRRDQKRMETRTGTALLAVNPVPSCPLPLAPKQYTSPPVVTPQAWSKPTLMCENVRPPATGVGTRREREVPSPTTPTPLNPQQYPAPIVVTAHVVFDPTSIPLQA